MFPRCYADAPGKSTLGRDFRQSTRRNCCRGDAVPAVSASYGIDLCQHHVDHLPHELATALNRVIPAGQLAGFQQEQAIILVGAAVRAGRACEELRKRLAGHEFGFVEDGLPKGFQGDATPEHLLRGGRVHCNSGACIIQKAGEFAATHIMDTPKHAMLAGQLPDVAAQGHTPVFKGMGFEDKVMVLRRTFCEFLDHEGKKVAHGLEPRMALEGAVMFQLQQGKMEGESTATDLQGRDHTVERVDGHQQQAQQVKLEFFRHGYRSVRHKVPIAPVGEHDEPMIERAVEHMLAHITPA